MKSKFLLIITVVFLLFIPKVNFGQAIDLGAAANFVIYTTGGAVHDNASAHSHLTGDVGYYTSGDFLGFGNVDGVMHPGVDPATTACELALSSAVAQINSTSNDYFPGLLLGNGVIFTPGVYSVPGNATMNLDLILDAQGDPTSVFIIKIQGTFSTSAGAKVKLINSAQACNVFWKVDGLVSLATNTTMRGTIIADNSAVNIATGDTIEGRVLSTTGSITIDGITAFTPVGCGSPVLTGPTAPDLASLYCYTIFSSIGAIDGSSSSTSIGDVGNAGGGSITGWTAGNVTGILHPTGDPSTMLAATDLTNIYNTLNAMIPDIELLYPAQFGGNLVLTPHVYLMNGSTVFTDSIYLNAQGNPDAVFVIQIRGATCDLTTSVNSRVNLINGTKPENVFWMVEGAVNINDNSKFRGNIIVPVGAINLTYTGVILEGRALTINGAITTAGMAATMPPPEITTEPANQTACEGDSISFFVTATGTGLTYQWRIGTVDIFGATNDTLTIDPVSLSDAALDYNVVIIGTCIPNDTSINVSLTVNPVYTMNNPQTICIGGSYTFNGNTYTIAGNYNDTLVSVFGCDSIIITQLTVVPFYETYNPQSICDGDGYTFNGNTYTLAGNYNDTLLSLNGCDSIIITQLTVNPVYLTNNPQTICDGGSYTFNGNTYTIAGDYNDTLVSVFGCDSIIITQLTVVLSYETNNPQTICDGDSYTFNGNTYTLAGNYNDTLLSINGCDSIIITQLSVIPVPVAVASSDSPVCAGNSINLTAQTVPGATYLWTNSNGYSSTDQNAIVLIATETDSGTYTLSVTVDACASVFAEITVIVTNCDTVDFFIPEGFSPNGDGINDLFVIRGIDNYPENTFLIYNRWGDKVFEASPYQNTWDGKSTEGLIIGGDELPISTYFYILDLGNGSDVYKGTIYLNK